MMNTLCTEADTQDAALVDGRPVNQWVKGANLYPDFTLENHNIFHPAYVGCSCYFLTQAVMYYTFGGRPVPQAATHHLTDTWHMFQAIILPWGEAAYPQGMDWELHGLPYLNLYASLATHKKDPLAARMEQCSLQYLRAWQLMGQGSLAISGSRFESLVTPSTPNKLPMAFWRTGSSGERRAKLRHSRQQFASRACAIIHMWTSSPIAH